jgi:hypothetical protein
MQQVQFRSSNNLDFLATEPYEGIIGGVFCNFKVGTCHGMFTATDDAYKIVAVINDQPGNGHFIDVLEWFENSARRDGKALEVVELMNDRLKTHLINKRGFQPKMGTDDVVKTFFESGQV